MEAQYHLSPDARWDPWIGIGTGIEWLRLRNDQGVLGLMGWELANAQLGLDYPAAAGFRVGPFASFALGEYESWFSSDASASGGSVAPKNLHAWLTLGIRGTIDPWPFQRQHTD